jgi:hypothetical protein
VALLGAPRGGSMTELDYLALYICSFALGGIVVVVLAVQEFKLQFALTLLFGFSGVSLFNSAAKNVPRFDVPGGNWTIFIVLTIIFLFVAIFGSLQLMTMAKNLRGALIPHLWNQPSTKPSTVGELSRGGS